MSKKVLSPMPGMVLKILVEKGEQVETDEELLTIEAMKMEVPIMAPVSGIVKEINVRATEHVISNQQLMLIE